MRDIYHATVVYPDHFNGYSEDALEEYRDSCGDAAFSIVQTLTVLGNLTLDASLSAEYSDQDARRDLDHLGSALRHLPRLMQALEQNQFNADYELKKRRGKTK